MTSLHFARPSSKPRWALLVALGAGGFVPLRAAAADAGPAASEGSSSVGVKVETAGNVPVDEAALRAAVAAELGLIAAPATQTASTWVLVRLEPEGELTVTYRAPSGGQLSRTVAAPGRADELPEITALLVGNLARDEARGLLGDLEPKLTVESTKARAEAAVRDSDARSVDAFNLSLFHPMTLLAHTEDRRLAVELGLFYSRVGALSGTAITLGGVSRVDGHAEGLQLAGIGYVHGGPGEGARVAGLFGVGKDRFEGVSLAGAAVVQDGELSGVALAGATVVALGDVDGGAISGAFNHARALSGFQLSGGANIAGANVDGVQLTGVANIAGGDLDGVQLAGGLNLADHLRGAQLGIVNVGGDVDGLQLGIVNVGRDVSGAQIGIVNVAREVDGVSLGLVPYSQRGRTQIITWYNTSQAFNLGVRFRSGVLYAMPTFGYDRAGTSFQLAEGEASYSAGFSLGVRIPIERASVDFDANYSNGSNGRDYDEHDVNLRYRLLVGWQFTQMFGVFAGGGVRDHFRTDVSAGHEVDPELSLGVELL